MKPRGGSCCRYCSAHFRFHPDLFGTESVEPRRDNEWNCVLKLMQSVAQRHDFILTGALTRFSLVIKGTCAEGRMSVFTGVSTYCERTYCPSRHMHIE